LLSHGDNSTQVSREVTVAPCLCGAGALWRHGVPIARDEADTTFQREPSGSLKYPEYGVLTILAGCCLLHDAATSRHGFAHDLVHRFAQRDDGMKRDAPEAGTLRGAAGVLSRRLPPVEGQRRRAATSPSALCAAATSDVATYSVIVPGFLCSCKVVWGREAPLSGRVSDTQQWSSSWRSSVATCTPSQMAQRHALSSPLASRARRSSPRRRQSTPSARRRPATGRRRRGAPRR
jgi:hypothetical protein